MGGPKTHGESLKDSMMEERLRVSSVTTPTCGVCVDRLAVLDAFSSVRACLFGSVARGQGKPFL